LAGFGKYEILIFFNPYIPPMLKYGGWSLTSKILTLTAANG
jgi:hypothetical protein